MMLKQPVFKDTKKIVKKFQEICDKNKDIDLHVHWVKKLDPTGKYISLVWTNPCKLNVNCYGYVSMAANKETALMYAVGNPNLVHDLIVPVHPEIQRTPQLYSDHQDEYRFVTDVKFEHEHYEYFWEEKLEKALSVIREYLKIAKKSDHERFYDIAVAMINKYHEYCAQIDVSLKSQEMQGRMVYLDLKHPDKVTLHMCMDDSVLATFTPEESERLYCIYHYNKTFRKYWRGW